MCVWNKRIAGGKSSSASVLSTLCLSVAVLSLSLFSPSFRPYFVVGEVKSDLISLGVLGRKQPYVCFPIHSGSLLGTASRSIKLN